MSMSLKGRLIIAIAVAGVILFSHIFFIVYWQMFYLTRYQNYIFVIPFAYVSALYLLTFKSTYGVPAWKKPKDVLYIIVGFALFSYGNLYVIDGLFALLTLGTAETSVPICALVTKHDPGPDSLYNRIHSIKFRYLAKDGNFEKVKVFYKHNLANVENVAAGDYVLISGRVSSFGFIVESIKRTNQCIMNTR